ncbi:hypothetical protein ACLMJK_006453 [Lecanora helva]
MDLDVTSWTPEQLQELLDGPAQKPPVGVVPNFKNSSTLAEYLILTLVLSLIIATLSLLFRIYTKAFILRSINFEDFWQAPARVKMSMSGARPREPYPAPYI